jgi:hypothetical protein
MIAAILKVAFGSALDRILDTLDRQTMAEADREKLRADIIREHYRTQADRMRAGGFVLMLMFALPLAVWWAAVILYSILWCQGCAWPQAWTIAALPPPLNQWAGAIVVSIFGVIGINGLRK